MTGKSSPARKPTDAYHHGDLRAALVDAVLAALDRDDPAAIGFSSLARRLGVSQAAPYRHFADRDALLAAVAAKGFRICIAELDARAAQRGAESRLSCAAYGYLEFGLRHVGLYQLMFASRVYQRAVIGSELQVAAEAAFDVVLAAIEPALDDLIRRRLALKFWTSLHGVVTLAEQGLLPPKIRQISVAELIDELVRDTERAVAAALTASR